jgi:hypothetical protein
MGEATGSLSPEESGTPPGLSSEYNNDLFVSKDFLSSFKDIGDALVDQRLNEAFLFYDAAARRHKIAFNRIGLCSLIFALVTLVTAAASVIAGEPVTERLGIFGLALDCGSILAIAFILWNRLARHKARWCLALFCRERLRQWHFQIFLDGELVSKIATDPKEFQTELDKRWGILQQSLHDGYGTMTSYMHHGSHESDFFHKRLAYTTPALAESVLEAMWTLRLDHQLRFCQRRIEREGEDASLTLNERTEISDSVASSSFAGAVLVGAFGVLLSIMHSWQALGSLAQHFGIISRVMAGIALVLTVISAASRAYRTGYTLPSELESYMEFCDRIREVKAVYENSEFMAEKFRQLEQLEGESIAELRRFLRMKMRATFVF